MITLTNNVKQQQSSKIFKIKINSKTNATIKIAVSKMHQKLGSVYQYWEIKLFVFPFIV